MVRWNYQQIQIDNPSFEGEYVNRGGQFVANGWTPWWNTGAPPREESQGPCAKPEYKPLAARDFPYRVTAGEKAQCWFAVHRVYDAGLMQFVELPEATPDFLQFGIDGQAWASNKGDPRRSEGEMYLALGIDAYGRTDPNELGVLWGPWWPMAAQFTRVESPIVKVYNRIVTLFVRAWPKWKMAHNDVIVDNALLQGVTLEDEGAGPGPAPPAGVDYALIRGILREELDRTKLST